MQRVTPEALVAMLFGNKTTNGKEAVGEEHQPALKEKNCKKIVT